jgi:hypothetical protein
MPASLDVAALHAEAARQFDQTWRSTGGVARNMLVGGENFRLRIAGRGLAAALTPAVEHLAFEPSGQACQLTIDVWESARSPIELTVEEWAHTVSVSDVLGPHDFVYCQADIGMLILFRGNHALVCYRDITEIPPWELAIPFRIVFNSWFQRTGGQVIHAAAVANDTHAVVLAGLGGAGKSSTALSCIEHPGLYYMSDDLCLLQAPSKTEGASSTAQTFVYSLYNSIKIRRDNLARFADMQLDQLDHLPLDRAKPTFFLYPAFREKLARRRPVHALLLPRIANKPDTQIRPATVQDAWRVLVPSTFAVVMGDRESAARNMFRLVSGLPVYWLELGFDRRQIAQAIYGLLEEPVPVVQYV